MAVAFTLEGIMVVMVIIMAEPTTVVAGIIITVFGVVALQLWLVYQVSGITPLHAKQFGRVMRLGNVGYNKHVIRRTDLGMRHARN